jgi:hypothetical protein
MLTRILDKKLALRNAGGPKRIRLDDVGPGFKKSSMDIADHLWLGQHKKIAVVQQPLGRVFKSLAAYIRLRHAVGADGRAHRAVDDGNAVFENLLQRMILKVRQNGYPT